MTNRKVMKRQFALEMSYLDMINSYSISDLKEIGKAWGIKGLSKYKKNELTNYIHSYILEHLEERFYLFNLDHLTIIKELLNGNNVFGLYPEAADELIKSALILEGNLLGEKKVVMPNEIFERFTKFYEINHETLTFNAIMKDYMDLTTLTYGVIPVKDFIEQFFEFNEKSIDRTLIESCVLYTSKRSRNSVVENGFVHYYRLAEFETVYQDIQTKDELVYRKIDHKMLQDFIANGYTLWSETHTKLEQVLEKHFNGDKKMTLDVIDELKVMLSYNHSVSDFIQLFSKKSAATDMLAIKAFADVIISINNEVAHWELKGNAPYMLSTLKKQETIVKGDKIKRNDVCPCGSGKKYKKCCLNKDL